MKILVAGDYAPIGRVIKVFENRDYEILSPIRDILKQVDYSIVNLECPVLTSRVKSIDKIGPRLNCISQGVEALSWCGFDCVTLANNHFRDFGEHGIEETLNTLKHFNIDYVGGGINIEEANKTLYKRIFGKTVAIINCCENEFSIASENSMGSNPLHPIAQYYSIKEAREQADYVLMIVHGGHEGYQLPSPRMQQTYRFFIDTGADLVINHHQHCYSGYELYNGKPIFYGLGNFLFDKLSPSSQKWNQGYMVLIEFCNDNIKYDLIHYTQCLKTVGIEILPVDFYNDNIEALNKVIADKNALTEEFEEFCNKRQKTIVADIMAPVGNRYLLAAMRRRLLPIFLSKKRSLRVCNLIRCESHRDLLLHSLENILNK